MAIIGPNSVDCDTTAWGGYGQRDYEVRGTTLVNHNVLSTVANLAYVDDFLQDSNGE